MPPVTRIVELVRRELAGYYAMIENLDVNLGRVVSALREERLYDDMHIVFFSDHGDMQVRMASSAKRLRGRSRFACLASSSAACAMR